MGYEVKAFIVQQYNFETLPNWPITGNLLAMVELGKQANGPLMALINRSRPAEGEKGWGLWAFNPDHQKNAVDFLRGEVKLIALAQARIKEYYGDSVQLEYPLTMTAEEIQNLSDEIEDGTVTIDRYGDRLAVMDADDVILALRQELQKEYYMRYRWLLKILFDIKRTFSDGSIKVIAYGH